MRKIIRQFRCTSKTQNAETNTIFSATIRESYGRRYIMKVNSKRHEKGILTIENTAYQYFETYEELKKEMEYHFYLCKNSIYTTDIKITI